MTKIEANHLKVVMHLKAFRKVVLKHQVVETLAAVVPILGKERLLMFKWEQTLRDRLSEEERLELDNFEKDLLESRGSEFVLGVVCGIVAICIVMIIF